MDVHTTGETRGTKVESVQVLNLCTSVEFFMQHKFSVLSRLNVAEIFKTLNVHPYISYFFPCKSIKS